MMTSLPNALFRALAALGLLLAALLALCGCAFEETTPEVYRCSAARPACPQGTHCNGATCVRGAALDGATPDGPRDSWPLDCADGATRPCYGGPAGTRGVGLCKDGTQRCANGAWGRCEGAVMPRAEQCDGKDNDCDGKVDDGLVSRSCYTGAAGTLGVGLCKAGSQRCAAGSWGTCFGQITPVAELCDAADNDCDGAIDEGLTLYTHYRDQDGDGFGTSQSISSCHKVQAGFAPQPGDCQDTDKNVHPGQTSYFALPGSNNYDYNCDKQATRQYTTLGACPASAPCVVVAGWSSSIPACGVTGTWISGCTQVGLPPAYTCKAQTFARVQRCR